MTNSVYAPKTDCTTLIPSEWDKPIEDAPTPIEGPTVLDTLKSWIGFGVAQTGKKKNEFERAVQSRGIIKRCIERDQKAVEKSKPKVLGII